MGDFGIGGNMFCDSFGEQGASDQFGKISPDFARMGEIHENDPVKSGWMVPHVLVSFAQRRRCSDAAPQRPLESRHTSRAAQFSVLALCSSLDSGLKAGREQPPA